MQAGLTFPKPSVTSKSSNRLRGPYRASPFKRSGRYLRPVLRCGDARGHHTKVLFHSGMLVPYLNERCQEKNDFFEISDRTGPGTDLITPLPNCSLAAGSRLT